MQVPEFFGESVSFGGGLVECSVNQCLADSGESSSGAKSCAVGEESFNRCDGDDAGPKAQSLKSHFGKITVAGGS